MNNVIIELKNVKTEREMYIKYRNKWRKTWPKQELWQKNVKEKFNLI